MQQSPIMQPSVSVPSNSVGMMSMSSQNYLEFSNQNIFGPQCEKTCLRGFANNKGADQPAHPRSPISTFLIRFLESIISKLASSDTSFF